MTNSQLGLLLLLRPTWTKQSKQTTCGTFYSCTLESDRVCCRLRRWSLKQSTLINMHHNLFYVCRLHDKNAKWIAAYDKLKSVHKNKTLSVSSLSSGKMIEVTATVALWDNPKILTLSDYFLQLSWGHKTLIMAAFSLSAKQDQCFQARIRKIPTCSHILSKTAPKSHSLYLVLEAGSAPDWGCWH